MRKIDWINSWKPGNKKKKFKVSIRLGLIDVVYIGVWVDVKSKKLKVRFMLLNYGFEI